MEKHLRHGITSLLMALGLTLSLLGCMNLLAQGWMAAALLTGLTVVLTLAWATKPGRIATAAVMVVAPVLWLVTGGMAVLQECAQGVILHFAGVNGALPMVAQQTAVIITLVMGVLCFLLTDHRIGAYPAVAVTILSELMLWLGDRPDVLPWLMPAVAGAITHGAHSGHEDVSLRRTLPMAAAIALLTLLLVPAGGVTIQPMKDAADKLREQIFDRFMFTQPRNVFTLASEGYYPQGQHQLGGKAEPTDRPVMLVKTPRKTYLRGSVKNEYTGRIWVDSLTGRRYLWSSFQWRSNRSDVFNMALPQGALGEDSGLMAYQNVSVKMLSPSASSLFVPQRIRSLHPGGGLVPYFNTGSEVFVTRDLQQDDTYTVTAPLMLAGDAGLGILIQACESSDDPLYPQILHDYTALPDHLQEQVFHLAQQASEGAQTRYEKAFAIQNFLSRNYRYTLDVAPQPENIDFVSNFLLNTKEGYCTYFASAMTVLCRMNGLPARYVEGYLAEPDEQGRAYVTGLHGHAWTEVYFEGFGWLTFDATPSQNLNVEPPEDMLPPEESEPDTTPEPEELPPESEPTPTPTPEAAHEPPMAEDEPTPQPSDTPELQTPPEPPRFDWLWWLLPLLAAAAIALRIILSQPRRCADRAKDEMGRWSVWQQAVSDALHVLKLPRQANESPMAYMRRIDGLNRFSDEMTPLGECMALVFYGRLTPEPEETAMAAAAYGQILQRMNPWQKLLLTLRRAFIPVKKRDFTK